MECKFGRILATILFISISLHANDSYWQQEVSYQISVSLNESQKLLNGHQILYYHNNSPDTLRKIYFHLYQNAFRKGSYPDQRMRSEGNYRLANLKPEEEGYCRVFYIKGEKGVELPTYVDNTIMAVDLKQPLLPGKTVRLEMDFTTKIGKAAYRIKARNGQFVVTQWYPKVCVYDRHGGWHLDQHFGHEFYGEFGTFRVEITLPADFIVGATGILLNREEVLPDSLMKRLDIRNFKNKPVGEKATTIIHTGAGETKTWKYLAENVHDFAWTADRTFRIGTAHWEDVTVYALARESKAALWQDAAEVGARTIRVYSEKIGRYPYPQMTIADVDQGMEYPMIVMCGGKSPTYNGLFYHEIGHNWFYGVIGSNETAYPLLDEGFTVFLTNLAEESLEDVVTFQKNRIGNRYPQRFWPLDPDFWAGTQRRYILFARTGFEQKVLTHSNRHPDRLSYRNSAYNKPASSLRALQGVLGDSIFFRVMRTYFRRWKFRHPYPEDFQRVAEEVSKRNLDWFFDQWWNRTGTCDYALTSLKNQRQPDGNYRVKIGLKRVGEIFMPVDLSVTLADGTERLFTIPVDEFSKRVPGITVLPKWYGWGNFNRRYTAEVVLPARAKRVIIDPHRWLPEVNYLNNRSGWLPKIWLGWDTMVQDKTPLDAYAILWRPSFGYNGVDGLKIGLHLDGSYLRGFLPGSCSTQLGVQYGVMSGKLNYKLDFQTPVHGLGRLADFTFGSSLLEGRSVTTIGVMKTVRPTLFGFPLYRASLHFTHREMFDPNYLAAPWNRGEENFVTLAASGEYHFRYHSSNWKLRFLSTTYGSDYAYDRVSFTLREHFFHRKPYKTVVRVYLGYAQGNVPWQEKFYLAGASPAREFEEIWYRSRGSLPNRWRRDGHLHLGGGGNLRGYLNRNIAGNRIVAANLEMNFPNPLMPFLRKIPKLGKILGSPETYAFTDIGDVRPDDWNWKIKADAGLGVNWNLSFVPPKLGNYSLRADFPLFVSDPPDKEDNFRFRWLVGISRAI